MTTCRLIIDGPHSGNWNMAADEYLLQSAAESNQGVLRLYQWSEPTLSLGYFQRYTDRRLHPDSLHCALVRRSSGGGAILHDHELTYCFVAPTHDRWFGNHHELYIRFHESIIATLTQMNVPDLQSSDGGSGKQDAFLCFERYTAGDVLIGKHKVVGSAQRRGKAALLQHGSILWRRSDHATELPGLADLSGTTISLQKFVDLWTKKLEIELLLDFREENFTEHADTPIEALITDRFGNLNWTHRR